MNAEQKQRILQIADDIFHDGVVVGLNPYDSTKIDRNYMVLFRYLDSLN